MRRFSKTVEEILSGIKNAIKQVDYSQVEDMLEALISCRGDGKKVLIVGAGRSGLVGRSFAMRLMHLGFNIYVMGETITPSIERDDLVLVISGSGSTTLPVTIAAMSKKLRAKVVAITSHIDSPVGRIADHIVVLSGRKDIAHEDEYHTRQLLGEHESLAPLGTLFEDSCIVFLDSVIAEFMEQLDISEIEMKRRHAAIE